MCIYIHKKPRRGVVVAAHSHRGGRSPSWPLVVEGERQE